MAVMNVWLQMARSQFQADDLDAALGTIDRSLQVESTAEAWALKERILTEKGDAGGESDRSANGGDGRGRSVGSNIIIGNVFTNLNKMSPLSKQILNTVDALPDIDQRQVLVFADFLRLRRSKSIDLQTDSQ